MITYTFKRLTFVVLTLVGITALTFIFIRIAPGNPASIKLQAAQGLKAEALSADVMDQTLKLYGLKVELPSSYKDFIHRANLWLYGQDPQDHPTTLRRFLEKAGQLGIQYKDWLLGIATLNFGVSYRDHRPVMESIKEALPVTLTLNIIEILIVYFISIPLGVFSAVRRQSVMEKSTMVLLLILYSLPNFWVATILLMYLAGGEHLNWFPMVGLWSEGIQNYSLWKQLANVAWHLVLPVTCMVYGSFAYLTRFSRTTMLEVIKQDYIRTALAKGLPRRTAIWKHAFRNSLIPLITLIGTLLPALLGGSIIIEQIFAIPGMGRLAFQSVLARDYPTIMAITTISAFLTLVSLLLSDLAYSWVDPRVTFKAREVR